MTALLQTQVRNRLLSLMSEQDFQRLAPDLRLMPLPKGTVLVEQGAPIEHVVFLEDGVGSIVVTSPEGHEVEAGLFGRDGFAPIALLLGPTSPATGS